MKLSENLKYGFVGTEQLKAQAPLVLCLNRVTNTEEQPRKNGHATGCKDGGDLTGVGESGHGGL